MPTWPADGASEMRSLILVPLLMFSCTREDTTEEQHNQVRLRGMVAGQPVDMMVTHDGTTESTTTTEWPMMQAAGGIAMDFGMESLLGLAVGGGVLKLIGIIP